MTWRVFDGKTVSQMHFNGADASTTMLDECGHTWTARGNAQLDTAQSVFGAASLVLDGTGDYIDTPDSPVWQLDGGSNSNKWAIDFRLMFNGDPGTALMGLVQQYADDNNFWSLYLNSNLLRFQIRSASTNIVLLSWAWNPATATWYHVALVKDGTNGYGAAIDGTFLAEGWQTDTDPMPDLNGALRIGRHSSGATHNHLNGWVDEFRISKGVARWTANFTVPTKVYQPAGTIAYITGN